MHHRVVVGPDGPPVVVVAVRVVEQVALFQVHLEAGVGHHVRGLGLVLFPGHHQGLWEEREKICPDLCHPCSVLKVLLLGAGAERAGTWPERPALLAQDGCVPHVGAACRAPLTRDSPPWPGTHSACHRRMPTTRVVRGANALQVVLRQ